MWHVSIVNVVTWQDVIHGGGSVTWQGVVDGDMAYVVLPHPSRRGRVTVDGQ
jgi:hypothetical protein